MYKIIVIVTIFILYRALRYKKKSKDFRVISHEQDFNIEYGKGTLDTGEFEFRVGQGNNVYSFFILYGEYLFNGKYTYTSKLEDADLKAMCALYEVQNKISVVGNNAYKYKKGFNELVDFYFAITLAKNNPFI